MKPFPDRTPEDDHSTSLATLLLLCGALPSGRKIANGKMVDIEEDPAGRIITIHSLLMHKEHVLRYEQNQLSLTRIFQGIKGEVGISTRPEDLQSDRLKNLRKFLIVTLEAFRDNKPEIILDPLEEIRAMYKDARAISGTKRVAMDVLEVLREFGIRLKERADLKRRRL